MTNITFSYEEIEPLMAPETNPTARYAQLNPNIIAYRYRVEFAYYGFDGVMITALSRVLIEDSYIDLEEIFMEEIIDYVTENPPPGLQMDFLVNFLELLNDAVPPAKVQNNLLLSHNINYVDAEVIEVNLYPLTGGSYHLPVKVIGKSAQEVVQEVLSMYQKMRAIN